MKRKTSIIILILLVTSSLVYAQYPSTKIKEINRAYTDSLKQVKYDNIFPIWGQKAYEKGFDIPYPTGAMFNYTYLNQGVLVNDLQLGLKTDILDIPLTPVDFIEFGDNSVRAESYMFRPDVWIFPFLNVYGLFGIGNTQTEVNLTYPVELKSIIDQRVTTAGFGLTAAGGIGPVWFAYDLNVSWTKPELLEDPVKVNTHGLRFGHNFVFDSKPNRNIGIWIGAMSVKMGNETLGEIRLGDALPQEVWDRAQEIEDDYFEWYNGLNPNNPIDRKKMEIADEVLTPIFERIGDLDGDAIVRYGLKKQEKERWNGVIGFQYQHNKNWMFRAEGGVIGDRKTLILSANYRFLL